MKWYGSMKTMINQSSIRKCKYCGSIHQLVDITALNNVRLSFEKGLEAENTGVTITLCNECFMATYWRRLGKV